MICKTVIVEGDCPVPLWGAVARDTCVRRLLTPHGQADLCYVDGETKVYRVQRIVREEARDRYVVVETEQDVYVYYRDVYEKIADVAYRTLEKPEAYLAPAVILTGPAGSGKSSMASVIIPGKFGVGYEEHTVTSFFSRYVGDSEKKTERVFKTAVDKQPIVLVLDEADTLLSKSAVAAHDYSNVATNVINIIKYWLAAYAAKRHRVLAVFSTNLTPSDILPEFARAGRGQIVTVPYLDRDGVRLLVSELAEKLDLRGIPTEDVVSTAVKRKLSPADVNFWLRSIAVFGERAQPPSGFTWTPPHCGRMTFEVRGTQCPREGEHVILSISGAENVIEALCCAVEYLSNVCGMSPVVLRNTDQRSVDDARRRAVATRSPLLVLPRLREEQYMEYLVDVREVPVVFLAFGSTTPFITEPPIGFRQQNSISVRCDVKTAFKR